MFSIDSRHPDDGMLADIVAAMRVECGRIADDAGLTVDFDETSTRGSVAFDEGCIDAVRRAAERLELPHRDIYSGAGHDACNLARMTPTGMIFVPCEKGASHCERENATPDDLAAGCDVLLHVVLERSETVIA